MTLQEIVLFETDNKTVERYASAFRSAGLELFKVAGIPTLQEFYRANGFDAVYWPLPGAERWNILPIEDVIQLVEVDEEYRSKGWGKYLLVGLALSSANAVDVDHGFKTWASALLAALKANQTRSILRVKVPAELVRLTELSPERAAAILKTAERENAAKSGDAITDF